MNYIFLLGRALFASLFLVKAIHHFSGDAMSHAAQKTLAGADMLVPIAGILALVGGLSILFGYKAKVGAWLLVLFLLPTTLTMHAYWQEADTYAYMMNHYCFYKNLSLIGACLMITHFGSGPLSMKH